MAVTEFGFGTYRDAGELANRDDSNIEWGPARPIGLKGEYIRDEEEQARYIRELLDVFESEGVDNPFVYTFARYDLSYRCATAEDFDLVSAGARNEGDRGRYRKRSATPAIQEVGADEAQGYFFGRPSAGPLARLSSPHGITENCMDDLVAIEPI